ncbi:MAG: biopolymer transport protein ExbD [Chlamydiales bacterium]|jgi:biopolymer transport protein ExbD
MSFISEEEVKGQQANYLAPMIDFLFLMLVFFASLAISRVTTKDTEIDLVKLKPETGASLVQSEEDMKIINITINENGKYKWVTEIHDYEMDNAASIAEELARQYEMGLLPEDKLRTQVLLKIDKKAEWEGILKLLFSIRDVGFDVRPIYEPEEPQNDPIADVLLPEEPFGGVSL